MLATLTNDEPPALRIAPDTGEAEEDVSDELTVTGHWKSEVYSRLNDRRYRYFGGFLIENERKYSDSSLFSKRLGLKKK